ncbi:hypothetical protein H4R23_005542 [Coemansia sp. Cherry 401B]|nr:hypothetical protein H4R23_005542 [Coemansia sp. Cherry 401B]
MQSNQPLFLTFSPGLTSLNEPKKHKKKSNVYKVSGINILNRNSVDSKTALERLQRRRENHNYVERRRRDNINHTITTLSTLIPRCTEEGAKLNKGSILHMAVDYIRDLRDMNAALVAENQRLGGSGHVTLPERPPRSALPSCTSTAQHSEYEDDDDDTPLSSTATSSPSASALPTAAGRKRSSSNSSSRASPDAAAEKRQMLMSPPPALPRASTLMPPPSARSTPHSPQPPLFHSAMSTGTHTPLPPIGAIAAPPINGARRPPAQSMPSSPSFRPRPGVYGASSAARPPMSGFNAHPFFNSDVSSIRHHLQPPRRPGFETHDLPPIAASAYGTPQASRHTSPSFAQR